MPYTRHRSDKTPGGPRERPFRGANTDLDSTCNGASLSADCTRAHYMLGRTIPLRLGPPHERYVSSDLHQFCCATQIRIKSIWVDRSRSVDEPGMVRISNFKFNFKYAARKRGLSGRNGFAFPPAEVPSGPLRAFPLNGHSYDTSGRVPSR